jgi:predicted AAA+ superfamily ATPase
MLFRNHNGSIVILDKYEFKTDELYYKKIKDIKFGKNDLLNTPKNSINYSNGLIDHILQRTSNNFENQE